MRVAGPSTIYRNMVAEERERERVCVCVCVKGCVIETDWNIVGEERERKEKEKKNGPCSLLGLEFLNDICLWIESWDSVNTGKCC